MGLVVRAAAILVLITGLTIPAFAQWPLGNQPKPQKKEVGPNITATGRFQIFVSPHLKGHTFMLDTDTGRIWKMEKDHSTGKFSWKRLPVEGVEEKSADDKKSGSKAAGKSGK